MPKVRVNADAFARLIEAVADRPRTYKNIEEETGLHYTTVRDYINALHRRKQVHIAGRAADSRGQLRVPMFLLGFGLDVPAPRMSAAERQRASRNRRNAAMGKPPSKIRIPKRAVNSVFALGDRAK